MSEQLGPRTELGQVYRKSLLDLQEAHADEIAISLGSMALKIGEENFPSTLVRDAASDPEREALPQVASYRKLIRIQRVGDILSRDWVMYPNGLIQVGTPLALDPDVLDEGTLKDPEPEDLVRDQFRILDVLTSYLME